jgi:hypothetical protein
MGMSNARECEVETKKVIMQEWLVMLGGVPGAFRIAPAQFKKVMGHTCM